MKQIKFRIWNERLKEFFFWGFMSEGFLGVPSWSESMPWYEKNSEQFTELKDKNGKEIYEGDIIGTFTPAPWDDQVPLHIVGVVTFGDPYPGCFCFKDEKSDNTSCLYDLLHGESFIDEVVGNIHENPELIKEVR